MKSLFPVLIYKYINTKLNNMFREITWHLARYMLTKYVYGSSENII